MERRVCKGLSVRMELDAFIFCCCLHSRQHSLAKYYRWELVTEVMLKKTDHPSQGTLASPVRTTVQINCNREIPPTFPKIVYFEVHVGRSRLRIGLEIDCRGAKSVQLVCWCQVCLDRLSLH